MQMKQNKINYSPRIKEKQISKVQLVLRIMHFLHIFFSNQYFLHIRHLQQYIDIM